jgi:cytochrome P450
MSASASSPPTASISTLAFWSRPAVERAETFAELRQTAPVSFQEPIEFGVSRGHRGFWAVTRHRDIQYVSRTPELFCSGQGISMGERTAKDSELNESFLVMDAPRHTKLRRLVSAAFTPRHVAKLEASITARAVAIVDELVERGGGDVVADLARHLPLWTISAMMGVPAEMRPELYRAAEAQIAAQDPEFSSSGREAASVAIEATRTLHRIGRDLTAMRRTRPADDILSTLVHSEVDGAPLSDAELGGIFVLFAVAGNDTTRNTTSHGVKLFAENPAQWSLLHDDTTRIGGAVEEILRCATPVIRFRRTATAATELAGVQLAEGDAVVMFYESANRDEAVFADAHHFDITRSPNPHVGFGGGGPHFCLGATLARAQLRAIFTRLSERVAMIEVGDAEYLTSHFINGIKRMPVTLTSR